MEKLLKSGLQLTDDEFEEWNQIRKKRDEAWNCKGVEICDREVQGILYARASSMSQVGEPEAAKAWKEWTEGQAAAKKNKDEASKKRKEFVTEWEKHAQQKQKKFSDFSKKVYEVVNKVSEQYQLPEAEESEDEEDKKFNSAFKSFENMEWDKMD